MLELFLNLIANSAELKDPDGLVSALVCAALNARSLAVILFLSKTIFPATLPGFEPRFFISAKRVRTFIRAMIAAEHADLRVVVSNLDSKSQLDTVCQLAGWLQERLKVGEVRDFESEYKRNLTDLQKETLGRQAAKALEDAEEEKEREKERLEAEQKQREKAAKEVRMMELERENEKLKAQNSHLKMELDEEKRRNVKRKASNNGSGSGWPAKTAKTEAGTSAADVRVKQEQEPVVKQEPDTTPGALRKARKFGRKSVVKSNESVC